MEHADPGGGNCPIRIASAGYQRTSEVIAHQGLGSAQILDAHGFEREQRTQPQQGEPPCGVNISKTPDRWPSASWELLGAFIPPSLSPPDARGDAPVE